MKKVALHNLGCKVNSYEIEVMQEKLSQKGYRVVPFAPGADIYVINTCTVTNIADRKSRQMLHKAKKMNPEAVVVAVGCYVQTGTEEVKKDPCIDLAIGNNRKKDIVSILEDYLEQHQEGTSTDKTLGDTTLIDLNAGTHEYEEMTLTHTSGHTRAYIKIQDGCNQFCSYCIIPFARGRVRSRKKTDILKEVEGLARAGYREIVVTGIHLSSYGVDFEEKDGCKDSLIKVLEALENVEGIRRIRLGSLEPRVITEEFAARLKNLKKLCPHFHLSLQSGCNATLKRMNRRYTTEEFEEKTLLLRQVFKDPAITTDVIVGFPGETEEEFEATKKYLERIRFYDMHVFKFSSRKGTAAAARTDQVDEKIKTIRSNQLIQMAKMHSEEYRRRFMGSEIEALIEERKLIDGEEYQVGFTPSYIKVAVKSDKNLENQLICGRAAGLAEDYLLIEFSACLG